MRKTYTVTIADYPESSIDMGEASKIAFMLCMYLLNRTEVASSAYKDVLQATKLLAGLSGNSFYQKEMESK